MLILFNTACTMHYAIRIINNNVRWTISNDLCIFAHHSRYQKFLVCFLLIMATFNDTPESTSNLVTIKKKEKRQEENRT